MKKVTFSKPKTPASSAVDDWVSKSGFAEREAVPGRVEPPAEPMKRFTIDVPEALHRRIKMRCAARGAKMADVIRELLEREFSKTGT